MWPRQHYGNRISSPTKKEQKFVHFSLFHNPFYQCTLTQHYNMSYWHVSCLCSGVPLSLEIANHPTIPPSPRNKRMISKFFQVLRPIYRESPCFHISFIFRHTSFIFLHIFFIFLHVSFILLHIPSYSWDLKEYRASSKALGLGKIPSFPLGPRTWKN